MLLTDVIMLCPITFTISSACARSLSSTVAWWNMASGTEKAKLGNWDRFLWAWRNIYNYIYFIGVHSFIVCLLYHRLTPIH